MATEITQEQINKLLNSLKELTENQKQMLSVQSYSLSKSSNGDTTSSPFVSNSLEHSNASAEAEQLYKGLIFDPKGYDERISRVSGLRDLMKEYVALKEQEKQLQDDINKQCKDIEEKHKDELKALDEKIQKYKDVSINLEATEEEHKNALIQVQKLTAERKKITDEIEKEKKAVSESNAKYKEVTKELNNCAVRIKNCEIEQDNWNKSIESGVKLFNQINMIGRNIKQCFMFVAGDWLKINDSVHKSGRALGQTTAQMRSFTHEIAQQASELGKFYNLDPTEIIKHFEQLADATGRVRLPLQNEQEMTAYLHNYGADGLAGAFDKIGGSVSVATARFTQMQKNAGALGLNLKTAQKSLQDNIGMMNKLTFRGGVNGFEKMILLSQQLKLNVKDIESMADKMNNVEGAVQVGAQMNALGGSFGANFSNPLELMYMANYNAEGLMEKLTKTLEGRAVFNEKTGIAEISAMDKQLLKTASQSLGVSYDSVLEAVNRKGVAKAIESKLTDNSLNETQRAMIANRATYDASKGKYMVKMSNGEEVDVSQINAQNVSQIVSDKAEDAQLDIRDNVRAIAQTLLPDMRNKSREQMSMQETYESAEKEMRGHITAMAGRLENIEGWFNSFMGKYGMYIIGGMTMMGAMPSILSTIGGLGSGARAMGSYARSFFRGNPQEYMDINGKQDVTRSYSGKQPSNYEKMRQDVARGKHGTKTSQALAKKKVKPKFRGKGKGGAILGGIATLGLIGGGLLMSEDANASTNEMDALNNLNDLNLNNNIDNSTLNNIVNDDKQVVKELQTQTTLLTQIAQANGVHIGMGQGSSANENGYPIYKKGVMDYANDAMEIGYLVNGARQANALAMSGMMNGSGAFAQMGVKGLGFMPNGVQNFLMKDAVKTIGKGAGPLGAVLGFGIGGLNAYTGISDIKEANAYLDNYNGRRVDGYATESDYYEAKAQKANGVLDTASGVGAMAGTIIGGVLGSIIPGAGTMAGATAGGFIGDLLGTGVGYLMGGSRKDGREMQNEDVNKFASEVEGFVSIDDPDLIPKAMLSVIKIHELLAYKWNKDDMKVNSHQTQQTLHAMQVAPTSGGNGGRSANTSGGGTQYVGGTTNVRTNQTQTIKLDISGNLKINGNNIDIVDFNKLAHNHEFVNAIISAINQKTQQNPTADSPIGKNF